MSPWVRPSILPSLGRQHLREYAVYIGRDVVPYAVRHDPQTQHQASDGQEPATGVGKRALRLPGCMHRLPRKEAPGRVRQARLALRNERKTVAAGSGRAGRVIAAPEGATKAQRQGHQIHRRQIRIDRFSALQEAFELLEQPFTRHVRSKQSPPPADWRARPPALSTPEVEEGPSANAAMTYCASLYTSAPYSQALPGSLRLLLQDGKELLPDGRDCRQLLPILVLFALHVSFHLSSH